MKEIVIVAVLIFTVCSCANSPEGSTNNEGSGASIRPDKTGDTSYDSEAGSGGGGKYSTDTMPGNGKAKGSDSNVVISEDSALIKMNTGNNADAKKKDPVKKPAENN